MRNNKERQMKSGSNRSWRVGNENCANDNTSSPRLVVGPIWPKVVPRECRLASSSLDRTRRRIEWNAGRLTHGHTWSTEDSTFALG